MKGQLATNDLLKVLQVRKIRAELSIAEQRRTVAKCRDSLQEAEQAVNRIVIIKAENLVYRDSVHSDARKITEAFNHRQKIELELERETYYQTLAEEELAAERQVLIEKKRLLEKIKSKQERVQKLARLDVVRRENILQEIAEEEFPAVMNGRRR